MFFPIPGSVGWYGVVVFRLPAIAPVFARVPCLVVRWHGGMRYRSTIFKKLKALWFGGFFP